jgi:8-oxo-dGTP pyrophosphatase MutT (NUDIX family)
MTAYDLKRLSTNLPKCPGIQAKEKFFNSAVFIPLILRNEEYHLLFQKRAHHIRQGGEICFPGGQHDPQQDHDYEHTAIRETIEELGIEREKITVIGRLDTVLTPQGVTIDPFLGILDIKNIDELSIDKNEVARVFILPMSHFENTNPEEYRVRVEVHSSYIDQYGHQKILLPVEELGLPERYLKPWGGREYWVLVYKTSEEIIWGMTAGIVYELVQKLHA